MPGTEPPTEAINERTRDFDLRPLLDQARLMNDEDRRVPIAVEAVLPQIADAIARTAEALRRGGRLVYVGAGTSGRIAALDAAECPPTFGTDPDQVQAVLAGGPKALPEAAEGAEDDERAGEQEMDARGIGSDDVVVGLAASGATPFVLADAGSVHDRGDVRRRIPARLRVRSANRSRGRTRSHRREHAAQGRDGPKAHP